MFLKVLFMFANGKKTKSIILTNNRINPFHATGLFIYSLKISENKTFSGVFWGV